MALDLQKMTSISISDTSHGSIARHLITSYDERLWATDEPVIFLGRWCCPYRRRNVWQSLNHIVAAPYGISQHQKDADYLLNRQIADNMLHDLCRILNQLHEVNYDKRSWAILIGHWLDECIRILINRIHALQQCLANYPINGVRVVEMPKYNLAPVDTLEGVLSFDNVKWNTALDAKIIHLICCDSIPIFAYPDLTSTNNVYSAPDEISAEPLQPSLKNRAYRRVEKVLRWLQRDTDALIINTYLPVREALKLELSLGQAPQRRASSGYRTDNTMKGMYDAGIRSDFGKALGPKNNVSVDGLIRSIIPLLLPICFLEGFDKISSMADRLSWPAHPKFIFTSNNFMFDELFKTWTVNRIAEGARYYVGQHGNNYGTHRYRSFNIEEYTAEKFITWGWRGASSQHMPAFIFKILNGELKYNSNGGLLMVQAPPPSRRRTWDTFAEADKYFVEQTIFVRQLSPLIRNSLTIRLYPESEEQAWPFSDRWCEYDASLIVEPGKATITELLEKSRLTVHGYDSTGILEGLAYNIPTIAFWQNGLDHLLDEAKPYYELLMEVGIIQLTPEAAATQVNSVWNDVDTWWFSDATQMARKTFCDRFARQVSNPIKVLKQILLK